MKEINKARSIEELKEPQMRISDLEKIISEHEQLDALELIWQKLSLFYEHCLDGVVVLDTYYRILYANKRTQEIAGIPFSILKGKQCFKIIMNRRRPCETCKMAEAISTKKYTSAVKHEVATSGKENWLKQIWYPILKKEGDVDSVVEIVRDITERKKLADELEASHIFLDSIINGLSDPVMVISADYRVKMMNKAACEFSFGRPIASEISLCYEVFHRRKTPCSVMKHPCPLELVRKSGQPVVVVHEYFRPNGQRRLLEIAASPLWGRDSSFQGIIESMRDITERNKIEEILRQSEAKYRGVFDSVPISIVLCDQDGQIIDINPWHIANIGKGKTTKKDYIGKNVVTYPSVVAAGLSQTYAATFKGESFDLESVYFPTTTGGVPAYLNVKGVPLSREGKIIGGIFIHEDITERKKSEMALRQSEDKYRTLLKNIPQKIFYKDLNSVYVLCNEAYANDLNIKPHEIRGRTDYEFYPRELADKYRADDKRIMQSGMSEEFEERYVVKGQEVIVHTFKSPLKDDKGKTIGIFGIFWDVTAHKKAKEEMRESEQRYRTIFEQSADAVVIIDSQSGVLVDFNDKAHNQLGYTRDEFKNLKIPNFEVIETPAEVSRHIEKIVNEGSDLFETKHRTKSGEIRDILVCSRVIHIHGRNYIQSIWRDITDRKRAEKELKKLNTELLRSNKKLRQLALKDSHTGLYNHRFFEDAIEAEFDRAKRFGHPLSLIMLDIDYFKSINDVYGHHFGDLVLKQFARLLKRMVRRYDIVVRFGGEEFIVICPGIDRTAVLILAQRLLDAVSLYNFGNRKHTVKLKLSLSIVSYPEDRTIKTIIRAMDLIEVADQILNKAKEYGGNRVYSSLDIKSTGQSVSEETESVNDIAFLREKIDKLTKRANQSLIEAVFAFAKTIELKDRHTGDHVEKIVRYSTGIASSLGLTRDEIEQIRQASILHDLGKIGISEKILLKKTKLSRKEFAEIKKHPQIGVDIIRPIHFLNIIIPLVLYHHERWDGRGYPNGLKAEEIPIGARVITIADAYEALTSNRPYRKAYSKDKALVIIRKGAGTQFDPQIVSIFLKILQKKKRL
jgi:diguanylate cyclase (GGDEF)-like protein/PAS domain S-box-containing protein